MHMPLIYGEGGTAFFRLQEAIMKSSYDQSLFAWWPDFSRDNYMTSGLLARSPKDFRNSRLIVPYSRWRPKQSSSVTSLGVQLEVELSEASTKD